MMRHYERSALIWGAEINPYWKLLLLAISEYLGANDCAWPSVRHLSKMTGWSRANVTRLLGEMDGFVISKTQRVSESGQHLSNTYQILWGSLEKNSFPHFHREESQILRNGVSNDTGVVSPLTGVVSPLTGGGQPADGGGQPADPIRSIDQIHIDQSIDQSERGTVGMQTVSELIDDDGYGYSRREDSPGFLRWMDSIKGHLATHNRARYVAKSVRNACLEDWKLYLHTQREQRAVNEANSPARANEIQAELDRLISEISQKGDNNV